MSCHPLSLSIGPGHEPYNSCQTTTSSRLTQPSSYTPSMLMSVRNSQPTLPDWHASTTPPSISASSYLVESSQQKNLNTNNQPNLHHHPSPPSLLHLSNSSLNCPIAPTSTANFQSLWDRPSETWHAWTPLPSISAQSKPSSWVPFQGEKTTYPIPIKFSTTQRRKPRTNNTEIHSAH